MKASRWIGYGFSFATALGLAYIGSAIFVMLLMQFELVRMFSTAHSWLIIAPANAFIISFAIFSSAVLAFGVLYAIVWELCSTGWNTGIEELWLT